MILKYIETLNKSEHIRSCEIEEIVSQRFFAVVEYHNGVSVRVEIPENILNVLKDTVFTKASELVIRQAKYLQFEPEPGKRKEDYEP